MSEKFASLVLEYLIEIRADLATISQDLRDLTARLDKLDQNIQTSPAVIVR